MLTRGGLELKTKSETFLKFQPRRQTVLCTTIATQPQHKYQLKLHGSHRQQRVAGGIIVLQAGHGANCIWQRPNDGVAGKIKPSQCR